MVLLFLTAAALGIVMPASLGRVVDAVTRDAGFWVTGGWVVAAGAGAIAAAVVALWAARILTALVQSVLASLREDVFASAMRLPVSAVDDAESADLLSRVTGDVDAVAEAGGNVVPTLLSAVFAVVVSVVALTAIDPWLGLAGLMCVPFYVIGTRAFLRRSRVVFREVRVREAARSQAVIEAVEAVPTLTALNEQNHALDRVQRRALASIDVQIDGVRLRNRLYLFINGGELVGLSALLATGFMLESVGTITVGAVTTAALVFHRLFDPIGQLIFALDDIQRASIGLARLVGVINLAASSSSSASSVERSPRVSGAAIDLVDVAFRYPTTGRGLDSVTLRVDAGTTVALVGGSGSGKSTLARVIAGHHPPHAGTVRLESPSLPYYISQELHQFRGTLTDNMRLAVPEASDAQIRHALAAVGADWALEVHEAEQVDTGTAEVRRWDEGRIQQLALARALLADPAVVILDEATADVGLHQRDAVDEAIVALRQGRTVVLIVHKLQQAVTADRIVVMADGQTVQQGTHDQLLSSEGPYRRFWLAQGFAARLQHPSSQNPTSQNHLREQIQEP